MRPTLAKHLIKADRFTIPNLQFLDCGWPWTTCEILHATIFQL